MPSGSASSEPLDEVSDIIGATRFVSRVTKSGSMLLKQPARDIKDGRDVLRSGILILQEEADKLPARLVEYECNTHRTYSHSFSNVVLTLMKTMLQAARRRGRVERPTRVFLLQTCAHESCQNTCSQKEGCWI